MGEVRHRLGEAEAELGLKNAGIAKMKGLMMSL